MDSRYPDINSKKGCQIENTGSGLFRLSRSGQYTGLLEFIFFLFLIITPLYLTISDYGITSDEPIYQEAAGQIKRWLHLEYNEQFHSEMINRYWKTDPLRNVHPSGTKIFYLLAQTSILWEKDPYIQNTVFNIFLFGLSFSIFLIWYFKGSPFKSITCILLLLSIPRFFAHAHFHATDIPMTSMLLLFIVATDKWIGTKFFWLPGIILGFFLSIKITSVLLAAPAFLILLIFNKGNIKKVILKLIIVLLFGCLTFYILNPDYWYHPLIRLREFLHQSTTRKEWTPITVFFGGIFYKYRAPWHYPFVMFIITTPIFHSILLAIGTISLFFKKKLQRQKTAIVLSVFVTPFIILSLPMFPAHDGIRYLLPAFPFIVCLMTAGLIKLVYFIRRYNEYSSTLKILSFGVIFFLILIAAADFHNPARVPPFELSYYNSIAGGLPGARRHGFEITYWWEILNDTVIEEINNLCGNSYVYFPLPPVDLYFKNMVDSKKFRFKPSYDINRADFMLIIGRPYVEYWERRTIPLLKKQNRFFSSLWGISLDSVPIIKLYIIKDHKQAKLKTNDPNF